MHSFELSFFSKSEQSLTGLILYLNQESYDMLHIRDNAAKVSALFNEVEITECLPLTVTIADGLRYITEIVVITTIAVTAINIPMVERIIILFLRSITDHYDRMCSRRF